MAIQPADKPIKLLLTGGGSGGHIRPLIAVADELKILKPQSKVFSVGDRGSAFSDLTRSHASIDRTYAIFAGKFRRYHGESALRQLLDIRTVLLNTRDVLYVLIGILQSILLIGRLRPDVVFLKGGFVGVPIGLAAVLWRIPIVTHDSDAAPGLANRIIGRWAKVHATAMPARYYQYDPSKVRHVGVLVSRDYTLVSESMMQRYRKEIAVPGQGRVLLVTGGSLGSQRINTAVSSLVADLLAKYNDLTVIHQVGKGNSDCYAGYSHPRLLVLEFLDSMHRYSGAADVIVTRAGANNLAEFGMQGKACIVVPSPFLAGGHQLKNADLLATQQAAIIVEESTMQTNPSELGERVEELLDDAARRRQLGQALLQVTVANAAEKLAKVLIDCSGRT